MEILLYLVIGIIVTAFVYMLVPVILRVKNGTYEVTKAKKIALWNSIILGVAFMVLEIELGNNHQW